MGPGAARRGPGVGLCTMRDTAAAAVGAGAVRGARGGMALGRGRGEKVLNVIKE